MIIVFLFGTVQGVLSKYVMQLGTAESRSEVVRSKVEQSVSRLVGNKNRTNHMLPYCVNRREVEGGRSGRKRKKKKEQY